MPALIWGFIEVLIGFVIRYVGPILLQALVFFGIQFVSQKYVGTPFLNYIQTSLSGLPVIVIEALRGVNMDKAMTIILSAYATAAAGRLVMRRKTP